MPGGVERSELILFVYKPTVCRRPGLFCKNTDGLRLLIFFEPSRKRSDSGRLKLSRAGARVHGRARLNTRQRSRDTEFGLSRAAGVGGNPARGGGVAACISHAVNYRRLGPSAAVIVRDDRVPTVERRDANVGTVGGTATRDFEGRESGGEPKSRPS